jgi:hypothetical protein
MGGGENRSIAKGAKPVVLLWADHERVDIVSERYKTIRYRLKSMDIVPVGGYNEKRRRK